VERLDRLLGVLRRRGLLRGEEIQRELGISQPVMSRLVREAGPRVCRFGRSVATRYAVPREIAGLGRRSPVFRVDELGHPNPHGVLHFLAGGGCWLERESGDGQSFPGLPPFVEDMRFQGYIGRGFPARHPELKRPGRTRDWSEEDHLIALAMRGEDCVGNLIIGEESLNRFLAGPPQPRTRADYPSLATGALAGQPGSSAGGEHPKFAVHSEGRHLLVKFAGGDGAAADRWRDLLVCEHLALEVLRGAGVPAPRSEWFDLDGSRYLEVDRFDRVGKQGRRGVTSLYAINCHYLGENFDSWSSAGSRICDEPSLRLDAEHIGRMVWLDTFGDLIGNTDRHFGNCCFFAEEGRELALTPTPVYDMLPMVFAPADANLVERPFAPQPPTALNLRVWHEVANHARGYWSRLCEEDRLSVGFRRIATACRDTLARLIDARA
jgi:HipA-like C-terminal domain